MSDIVPIRCRGLCRSEKPPSLFPPKDVQAFLRVQASGGTCCPVCRKCRRDRTARTGLYATTDFAIVRPQPLRSGWVFREQAASLCPGSAAALYPGEAVIDRDLHPVWSKHVIREYSRGTGVVPDRIHESDRKPPVSDEVSRRDVA
jgi:hypothetical protein